MPAKPSTAYHRHFVFYANASANIGSGHVMRLLAIAQCCANQSVNVTFAYRECAHLMLKRLEQEGFEHIALPQNFTQADIDALTADAIFVDDYQLSASQWQIFAKSPALLINLDDNINHAPVLGDIIINPAADANEKDYRARNADAQLCLGPTYTYLRDEFVQEAVSDLSNRQQILITLGGADVKNMAFYIVSDLIANLPSDIREYGLCILLGGLNTSAKQVLHDICNDNPNVRLIEQSDKVAALMNKSGLAVSAAGGTLGELACMGVPTLALVSSDNQLPALKSPLLNTWYEAIDVRSFNGQVKAPFDNDQTQLQLSAHDKAIIATITCQVYELWRDLCKRQNMHNAARQFIDSQGCSRIVERVLNQLS